MTVYVREMNEHLVALLNAVTIYNNSTSVFGRDLGPVVAAAKDLRRLLSSWQYNREDGIEGEPDDIRKALRQFYSVGKAITDTPELLNNETIGGACSALLDSEGIKRALEFSLLINDVKQRYSWTDAEIERMVNLSDGTIGRAIRCQRMPEEPNLQKISAVFGTPAAGIIGDPGDGEYSNAAEVRRLRSQIHGILDQLNHIQLEKLEVKIQEALHDQQNLGENTP